MGVGMALREYPLGGYGYGCGVGGYPLGGYGYAYGYGNGFEGIPSGWGISMGIGMA